MSNPPLAPPIALLQQSSAEDLLTLKDLSERLGVTYGRLRGFAEVPGVAPYVGAVAVPGVKGVRYLPAAESQFRRLIAAQDDGLVTPRTAKAHLQNLLESPLSAIAERQQSDNAPGAASSALSLQFSTKEMSAGELTTEASGRGLAALLERLVALQEQARQDRATPAPDDRLVARDEAAGMLACSPRAVGRYVRPVRAGVWRRSDLRGYIAGLVQR